MIFFFFNDTATTEIYTLSLHDALPICPGLFYDSGVMGEKNDLGFSGKLSESVEGSCGTVRSEEHTSELQSH